MAYSTGTASPATSAMSRGISLRRELPRRRLWDRVARRPLRRLHGRRRAHRKPSQPRKPGGATFSRPAPTSRCRSRTPLRRRSSSRTCSSTSPTLSPSCARCGACSSPAAASSPPRRTLSAGSGTTTRTGVRSRGRLPPALRRPGLRDRARRLRVGHARNRHHLRPYAAKRRPRALQRSPGCRWSAGTCGCWRAARPASMSRPRVVLVRGHQANSWHLRPWNHLGRTLRHRAPPDQEQLVRHRGGSGSTEFRCERCESCLPRGRLGDLAVRIPGDRYLGLREALAGADIVHSQDLVFWYSAQAAALKESSATSWCSLSGRRCRSWTRTGTYGPGGTGSRSSS